MTMSTDCIDLASDLSERYRNTSPFGKSSTTDHDLPRYLSTHGLLLTMCFPWECALSIDATHVSGSWINQRIGPQVIAGPEIGLILDPLQTDIQCIYPTDTASDQRDNAGCGPHQFDPTNPVTRYLVRKQLTAFKNMNFGIDTAWEDIACEYFMNFAAPSWFMPLLWQVGSDGEIQYQSQISLVQGIYEGIMGHPVCTINEEQDTDDQSLWTYFINTDQNGWDPLDFERVLEMQLKFMKNPSPDQQGPAVLYNWNEIIMSLPSSELKDLVVSVFYMDSPKMDDQVRARRLKHAIGAAKIFGGKPVIRLQYDVEAQEDILTCPDELEVILAEDLLTSAGVGGGTGAPSLVGSSSGTREGGFLGTDVIVKRRELFPKGPTSMFK
jgi:hypothetical protein